MNLKPPYQQPILEVTGQVHRAWQLFFQKLATGAVSTPLNEDFEVTGSDNGIILESPNGTRWRVQVDNSGNLTTTSL